MIFCLITDTPCIVLNNYNHKIIGTYDWISNNKFIKFVNCAEEFSNVLQELDNLEVRKFDRSYLKPYYDKLVLEVKDMR